MAYLAIAARLVPVACCQLLTLTACRAPNSREFMLPREAMVDARFQDSDSDGLCDATEDAVGTDPEQADTDLDGLPDGQEAIAGTDPQNTADPAADHVLYLPPTAGTVTYDVLATIDGRGGPANGYVVSRTSLDPSSRRAADYYAGVSAEDAEPPENARNIQAIDARFGRVVGQARLHFLVSFTANGPANPELTECAAALPFDFVVSDDKGAELVRETYILVIAAANSARTIDFCAPVSCL